MASNDQPDGKPGYITSPTPVDELDRGGSPPSLEWRTLLSPLPDTTQVLVMACDICSSSEILEDVTTSGSIDVYRSFLSGLKRALVAAQRQWLFFEPYKFTGDGWILLFPQATTRGKGVAVLELMTDLCEHFRAQFEANLRGHLDVRPDVVGLNFGLDSGPIFHSRILQKDEYIGRPIVVATRLQGEIKKIDAGASYQALVSNRAFYEYFEPVGKVSASHHSQELRNVARGRPLECKRITLL